MSIDISQIKILCFDVDGTLSDTDNQFVERITGWLQPMSVLFPQFDPRTFARRVVMSLETPGNYLYGIPDRLGIDDEIAALADFIYRLGLGKTTKPFKIIPGIRGMLESLQPHYPLAIVSARGERSTNTFLNQFHITPFFRYIATAQTCKHTKPYPDPILWVADQLNRPPSSCLMVGDTRVDILAAKAAGAQSVGVLCGFGEEQELLDSGADLILRRTPDLLTIFGKNQT